MTAIEGWELDWEERAAITQAAYDLDVMQDDESVCDAIKRARDLAWERMIALQKLYVRALASEGRGNPLDEALERVRACHTRLAQAMAAKHPQIAPDAQAPDAQAPDAQAPDAQAIAKARKIAKSFAFAKIITVAMHQADGTDDPDAVVNT